MKIEIVPASFTDQAWEDGADCLTEACEKSYGEVTASQLKMLCAQGHRILARLKQETGVVGWACGEIIQKPNVRVFHVTSLVCHNGGYQEAYNELKNMAKSAGCSYITFVSDDAVARLHRMTLKDCEIEKMYSVYRMKV